MPEPIVQRLFAPEALLPAGWASDVAITVDAGGAIATVTPGSRAEPGDALAAGPVVAAMPNLHSHAFQRAMAGLAEIAGSGEDSFWTWREEMYRIVGRLSPADVEAIAAKLYLEMLKGGFGAVGEFHYLHHDLGGVAYTDPSAMSGAILRAADATGIGLTLLPVFYAHANFGGTPPGAGQARFIHTPDAFLRLLETLQAACALSGAQLGYAFHSLRAATLGEMQAILAATPIAGPIHIHVAEQQKEVDDCLAATGQRPVAFLLDHLPVDDRWCLIHATQSEPAEIARLAASGAVVGLCPATEANLGDGIFPAVDFLAQNGRFGIGTDSHVATSLAEELRLLEYGQRLRDRRRNRLADAPGRSVGRSLFDRALRGGAQALGQKLGTIAPGTTASLVVLDGAEPFIGTARADQILDRWLFALGDRAVRDVMIAGRWQIRDRRHRDEEKIDGAFRDVLTRLSRT